ncbi:hypothetical protein [Spirosoma pomorum]
MKSLRNLSWLLILMLLVDACQNPLEDLAIGLKDPIQAGVIECRLYDPAGNPLPKDARVTVAGPDAAKIVTTLNSTRYRVNTEGVVLLAVAPGNVASIQQPLRFTVVVEATDYLTIVQPVVMTNMDRITRYIRWINTKKPPRTMAAIQATGRASNTGATTEAFQTTSPSPANSSDIATVVIPAGAQLTDRDNQAVGNNLTMNLLYTNAREEGSTSQVPGGGIFSNVIGKNGANLGNLRVISIAGSVSFEVYNQTYQLADASSQPISWSMSLNPNTINGQNGRSIQPGDSIPLYSYDGYTGIWRQEPQGVVVRNSQSNSLELRAAARRFVTYVAAWTDNVCASGPIFQVTSDLKSVDVNYLCKLIDATTNQQVGAFYANVNNGAYIGVYNQPQGRKLKIQVFDETDAWGKGSNGGMIAESGVGESCSQTPIAINLKALPVPPVMNLEFAFSCPGGTQLDESLLPSLLRTQYSEAGKEQWRDLITATRTERRVESYKIQIGRTYDFRASTDGGATWPLRQNNYLVDKPEWVLKIRSESYCK